MIVLTVVVLLGLKGIFNGFSKELFGLLGIVGGLFLASRLAGAVGESINMLLGFSNPKAVLLIGFVLTLSLVWIGFLVMGGLLGKLLKASGLAAYDKILGFTFAAGKVFIVFSIIAYAFSNVAFVARMTAKYTEGSMLYPALVATGSVVLKIDPEIAARSDVNITIGQEAHPRPEATGGTDGAKK